MFVGSRKSVYVQFNSRFTVPMSMKVALKIWSLSLMSVELAAMVGALFLPKDN